jgi:hypothetical protein
MRSTNKVHVLLKPDRVVRLAWEEAKELVDSDKAHFISNNLFRFAKLGGDITKMATNRPDDAVLKAKIAGLRGKSAPKKKKTEDE